MKPLPPFAALALALAAAAPAARASTFIGNGGDTVECAASPANAYVGTYSLDYLVLAGTIGVATLVDAPSWEASRDRLQALLAVAHPDLADSFARYSAQLFNEDDFLKARRWISSDLALTDIQDEALVQLLPANCRQIRQTVVRQQRGAQIVYNYRADKVADLRRRAPLQFSLLMVHEWLWEFVGDAEVSRQVNFFLHSKAAAAATPQGFQNAVANLGLDLSEIAVRFKDFCTRPTRLRDALLRGMLEFGPGSCDGATRPFFAHVAPAGPQGKNHFALDLRGDSESLDGMPALELAAGDFAGISASPDVLWDLDLGANGLTYLPSVLFRDFFDLYQLKLGGNALRGLSPSLLANAHRLTALDLSANGLTSLPLKLEQNPDLAALNLAGNRLASVPPVVAKLGALARLDLSGNPLGSLAAGFLPPQLTRLESLGLADCGLTAMPAGLGGRLKSVMALDLSDNPLGAVPEAFLRAYQTGEQRAQDGAANLARIGATDAGSAALWRDLFVNRVSLAGNRIAAVSAEVMSAWAKNRALRELDLAGNGLASLGAPTGATGDLVTLDLSGNQLTEVPAGVLKMLDQNDAATVLKLTGNPLSAAGLAAAKAWCAESRGTCEL